MHGDSIGDRLKQFRGERGMTQEALARKAGISADTVRKLEQNQRTSASLATLAALSRALGVTKSALLDRGERLGREGPDGILAVRDALLSPADLYPGIGAGDTGEAVPPAGLEAAVRRGWGAYWGGNLGDLAAMVPGLISGARAAGREGGPGACRALAQAYQLAGCLCVHTGYDNLAAVAAERALSAAERGDDELQHAVLGGTASWVLLHQGRYGDAEAVARKAAEAVEPRELGSASPARLTVYGALLLSAAAPAAAAGRASAVAGYMEAAAPAAARLTADRHDYEVSFGPTQLAMQRCYTSVVLGEPGRALDAARGVRREDLLPISWGAHNLDVALAHLGGRRYRQATGALLTACEVSPVWFRHQGLARTAVQELVEHERRLSGPLRRLQAVTGIS